MLERPRCALYLRPAQRVHLKTVGQLSIRKAAATAAAGLAAVKAGGASARWPDVREAFMLADARPAPFSCWQRRLRRNCRPAAYV
jgi:hypothetical protein